MLDRSDVSAVEPQLEVAREENSSPTSPASAEKPFMHLYESVRAQASLPDAQRIALVRKGVVIEHPAFAAAMDYASWLLTHPGGSIGRGMLLSGDSGSGKTTFGNHLLNFFPDDRDGRIVKFDASGAKTTREVYGRILQSLDGPVARNMHAPDRELAVVRLFRALNVKALIIDEVQDIAEGNDREQRRVLDAVKYLMNTARIPLIGLGAPESERALVTDKHLAQRLAVHRLEPWHVNQGFLDFVGAVESSLPLRSPSELRHEKVLKFLIEQTGGSLRPIMELITRAAVRAILTKAESLTLQGLQQAVIVPSRNEFGGLHDA